MASRVLIINDYRSTCETFSLLLRMHGFETATATTGRDGVTTALAASFDVILVDLNLPDISGTDVVRELKAHGVQAPMVIVTTFPELKSSCDAHHAGAAGFVDGLLFGDEVVAVVQQALGGSFPVRHPGLPTAAQRQGRSEPKVRAVTAALLEPECLR